MNNIRKVLEGKARLFGRLETYLNDDINLLYLYGLMTGSTALMGLTDILEGEYLRGCGNLALSYFANGAANYHEQDIREMSTLHTGDKNANMRV